MATFTGLSAAPLSMASSLSTGWDAVPGVGSSFLFDVFFVRSRVAHGATFWAANSLRRAQLKSANTRSG